MAGYTDSLQGLTSSEAARLLALYGRNELSFGRRRGLLSIVWGSIKEPMFIVLCGACSLYFLLGEPGEGAVMLAAMLAVSAISVAQEVRSAKALEALRQYMAPMTTVMRDGQWLSIKAEDLVPGDVISLEEGERVPADARILEAHDLSMNESLVTGEAMPVEKGVNDDTEILYQGTTVNAGSCRARITGTGTDTLLGRLGRSVEEAQVPPTRLQAWIARIVRAMALFGLAGFLVIGLMTWQKTGSLAMSLLTGLTLAMSAIPEEIPVAFISFMALAARRMASMGIIVRYPRIVENLGAVSIICLDKTGTLTENRMQLSIVQDAASGASYRPGEGGVFPDCRALWIARLACEPEPFDAMEKAIVEAFVPHAAAHDAAGWHMVHEYPLGGQPPMMTHVYEGAAGRIVAGKGAPERIFRTCRMSSGTAGEWQGKVEALAMDGYRVLGICSAVHEGVFPESQDDFDWRFEGLVAIMDPPKPNLKKVFAQWRDAGIAVAIISGDHPRTVLHIARLAGMDTDRDMMTGQEVMALSDEALARGVSGTNIFARMFPDAKTRVIEALKANGNIVAMSGDGVNDAPALRSAHVGMAMGKRGTELARAAADLVITDDDLERITEAVRCGRTVRNNLSKAIRYMMSIHIPIILTASLPQLLGWAYPAIFTPLHIIFLELIMGPTCSIFFEREPAEKNVMAKRELPERAGLFSRRELVLTLVAGGAVAAGLLGLYYFFMVNGYDLAYTRTIVFLAIMMSNIWLTFTSRSSTQTLGATLRYTNSLAAPVLFSSVAFICLVYFLQPLRAVFGLTPVFSMHAMLALAVSLISVGWVEIYKYIKYAHR